MLGLEGLGADHGLPDVPLGPLPDLHPQLVRPGVQVPLQPDISSVRAPGFWLRICIFYVDTLLVANISFSSVCFETHFDW